ncbi:bifunctional lysylphosphatidylglycerol flippase/synthetase MprF [Dactylosporangium sp. NPDC051541]|uniref:bifunctional lysylphosphatidylglycerol flippase/synthetase MprF n=1 Tax=Dactylosporangium sp. NPDC051541 TaxID=3363977 RepID=UPI00379D0828
MIAALVTTAAVFGLAVPFARRIGRLRTAAVLAGLELVVVPAALALLAVLDRIPGWWVPPPAPAPLVRTLLTIGALPAVLGLTLAGSAVLAPLWRRRTRLLLVPACMMLLYAGRPADFALLVCAGAGLAVGPLLRRRGSGGVPVAPSTPEIRTLLALVVAAGAVGPLIAVLAAEPQGPLAVLRFVVLATPPDVTELQAACTDPELRAQCRSLVAQLRADGLGPLLLSVLPVGLLLLAAEGLRRGRRLGLWLAVAANVVLALAGALAFDLVPRLRAPGAPFDDPAEAVAVVASVALPLLVAALLAAHRRYFPARSDPARVRAAWAFGAGGPLLACGVYLAGGWLLRHELEPVPTFTGLLLDLPTRLLPVGYLDAVPPAFVARSPAATVLLGWAGTAAWLAVLTGIARTYAGDRAPAAADDAARARDLLVQHGGDALSYMLTWPGNTYWFSADGRTAIAYRVHSSVALTLGGPVGDPAGRAAAMEAFSRDCLARGWRPCFYSIDEETARSLAAAGWSLVQVAEETRVGLPALTFRGRQWQDVRTALNRAARDGLTAEWHRFREAPPAIAAQIRAVSDEWTDAKGLPEMRFTLGGVNELNDDAVRCLIAVDAAGQVHGITSWLPVYCEGAVKAWTLDVMRRLPGSANGVMEFLIATAAQQFRDEGAEYVSLSGVPLALREPPPPTGLPHLLHHAATRLEPVYGFRALLAFKSKFQPQYRPLYLAYTDPAALPAIGTAVLRAYLPELTATQSVRLARRLLRS